MTREHAATFRAAPGARACARAATGVPGLVLAGAWTDTGWPATMEGAVRSGHAAARGAGYARERHRSSRPRWRSERVIVAPMSMTRNPPRSEDARAEQSDVIVVLAPLALEARAVRAGAPWATSAASGWVRVARPARRSWPAAGGSRADPDRRLLRRARPRARAR